MTTDLAHHNPSDPNFNIHTIQIGATSFCMGCTASKLFLHLVLPALLLFSGAYNNFNVYNIIFGLLWTSSSGITLKEFTSGNRFNLKFLNSIPAVFTSYTIGYTAFQTSSLSIQTRLVLSLGLATPQLIIYVLKTVTESEFKYRSIKFSSRLLLIIGFYYAVIDLVSYPIISSIFIAISGILFVKLRKFSDYRVNDDKIAIINPSLSNFIGNKKLTYLKSHSLLFMMFLFGIISLVSLEPNACNSGISSAGAIVPVLAMSKPNFCPDCGDPVDVNERFCDNCGRDLLTQSGQQNNRQNQNYTNQGYQNDQYYGSGGGYYSKPQRQGREDARGMAIAAGILFFFIGILVSGNLFIGIIVGVIAFGGITLAASTDNCCFQYLILDCCSDCICSILGASSRRR